MYPESDYDSSYHLVMHVCVFFVNKLLIAMEKITLPSAYLCLAIIVV